MSTQNIRELAQRLLEARKNSNRNVVFRPANSEDIEHLCTALLEFMDTVEFYGNKKNWLDLYPRTRSEL